MAISITLDGKTFNIPVAGEDPGWGEDTTSWIQTINALVSDSFGSGDIVESASPISNDQSVAVPIIALFFDASVVRAGVIEYSIYRASDNEPTGRAETGTIEVVYDNNAGAGNKWQLTREFVGDSAVNIDITDDGQLTYTSDAITFSDANSLVGEISFRARAFTQ